MTGTVFISHASEDADVAKRICECLEERGIGCWLAPRDIPAGFRYPDALVDAIGRARILLLVYSSKANQSDHVAREVERAVAKGMPVLAVRIDESAPNKFLEYFLSAYQYLDQRSPDTSWDEVFVAVTRLISPSPKIPEPDDESLTPVPERPPSPLPQELLKGTEVSELVESIISRLPRKSLDDSQILPLAEDLFRRPAFYSHPERSWEYALYAIIRTRIVWEQQVMPRLSSGRATAGNTVLAELLALEDFHGEALGISPRELTNLTAKFIHSKEFFIRHVYKEYTPQFSTRSAREWHQQRTEALRRLEHALIACNIRTVNVGAPGQQDWGRE